MAEADADSTTPLPRSPPLYTPLAKLADWLHEIYDLTESEIRDVIFDVRSLCLRFRVGDDEDNLTSWAGLDVDWASGNARWKQDPDGIYFPLKVEWEAVRRAVTRLQREPLVLQASAPEGRAKSRRWTRRERLADALTSLDASTRLRVRMRQRRPMPQAPRPGLSVFVEPPPTSTLPEPAQPREATSRSRERTRMTTKPEIIKYALLRIHEGTTSRDYSAPADLGITRFSSSNKLVGVNIRSHYRLSLYELAQQEVGERFNATTFKRGLRLAMDQIGPD